MLKPTKDDNCEICGQYCVYPRFIVAIQSPQEVYACVWNNICNAIFVVIAAIIELMCYFVETEAEIRSTHLGRLNLFLTHLNIKFSLQCILNARKDDSLLLPSIRDQD